MIGGNGAQTISGSGSWITTSYSNAFYNLSIINASGVSLNPDFAIQNALTLSSER